MEFEMIGNAMLCIGALALFASLAYGVVLVLWRRR